MHTPPETSEFQQKLAQWQRGIHRPMPWKGERDPYRIWISEIILQQTRVEQGWPYYERFIDRFPTVETLASAPEDEVLKLWEGLGYYSRARNLLRCARIIAGQYQGQFPQSLDSLLKLPGIGPYTAAAIASFAFNAPHAVVDGNVERVLSRIWGIETPADSTAGKKTIAQLAQQLLDEQHPGAYNQAMMDFGAIQCLPRNPLCGNCPFQEQCYAFRLQKIQELPAKSKKTAKRSRFFHYLVVRHKDAVWMRQRPAGDIWAQLWEFPLLERSSLDLSAEEAYALLAFPPALRIAAELRASAIYRQTLSHQVIIARFLEIRLPEDTPAACPPEWISLPAAQLSEIAVPRIIRWYLEEKNVHLNLF